MHIEVWLGHVENEHGGQEPPAWFWHFKNKGRITADAEEFPTKSNAIRAAKAVVKAVFKEAEGMTVQFVETEAKGVTRIKWSAY